MIDLEAHWGTILDRVIEAVKAAAAMQSPEKLIGEGQIRAAVYSYFSGLKWENTELLVHAEAGYLPHGANKCDVRMRCDQQDIWIEIKTTMSIYKGGAPLPKSECTWRNDLGKLKYVPSRHKYFLLFVFKSHKHDARYDDCFSRLDLDFGIAKSHTRSVEIKWHHAEICTCQLRVWKVPCHAVDSHNK